MNPSDRIRDDYIAFGRPSFGEGEIAAVERVLRSGWVGMGPETQAFEAEMADRLCTNHVVAVNSCTSALFLSLKALRVGPEDEVIVPSLTWASTANAVIYAGATPVFCDVDPLTLSLTPATVAAVISKRTRAVIPVHFGGRAVDIPSLASSLPSGVAIVEDAAHALGSRYPDGRPVGSSGHLTCFSFYANKNLSTGDGGAIAVQDGALADTVRLLSHQGLPTDAWKRFTHPLTAAAPDIRDIGYKMNYTDLQACVGRVQLQRQNEFDWTRRQISGIYRREISASHLGIGHQSDLDAPGHARHLFVVTLPVENMSISRNEVLHRLRQRNIGASIHYTPLHHHPIYQQYLRAGLPVTDDLSRRILTLPIGACMSEDDARYVSDHFVRLIQEHHSGQAA